MVLRKLFIFCQYFGDVYLQVFTCFQILPKTVQYRDDSEIYIFCNILKQLWNWDTVHSYKPKTFAGALKHSIQRGSNYLLILYIRITTFSTLFIFSSIFFLNESYTQRLRPKTCSKNSLHFICNLIKYCAFPQLSPFTVSNIF